MQSLQWYVNRLRTMSPAEIAWRVKSLLAAMTEQTRVSLNWIPKPQYVVGYQAAAEFQPPFRVADNEIGSWANQAEYQQWLQRLVNKADLIAAHKLSFFDLKDKHLGDPIDWNRDHGSNINAPLKPILQVDYRDCPNFGDCKLVWEPNRHHHLVVLGRAYRATGDMKYAEEVVAQITSWLDQSPYGKGMNWRSPLELGIRLINWVWAIDLILESGLFAGEFKARLLESVFLHCRDVAGKYSQGSSANNHLVGEAAGVYVAARYFNVFANSEQWAKDAKVIVDREIVAQSFPDGCTREHALGYQFFVFQFYLICGLVGRKTGDDFNGAYWKQLELLTTFIAQLSESGGCLPMFGDRDDGYVLDLGEVADNVSSVMDVASHVFENDYLKSLRTECSETGYWLFGLSPDRDIAADGAIALESRAFKDSGYYLLQHGSSLNDCASLLVDVAELGYTAIAAHGHADALAFTMRVNGQDLLVDSGTFDYFTYPKWRNFFRTTKAHNTVEVDGQDQSLMTGPFMWEKHAKSQCKDWSPSALGGVLVAEHDGYSRLEDPLVHERAFDLNGDERTLKVVDHFSCQSSHSAVWHLHLSEFCQSIELDGGKVLVTLENATKVEFDFDPDMDVSLVVGDPSTQGADGEPGIGWLSRGYHQKVPITTIVAKAKIQSGSKLGFEVRWTSI